MTDKDEQGIYAAMPRILTIISAAKRVMENGHGHEDDWKAEFLSAAKDGELTIHDYCSGSRVEPILFSKVKTEEFQRYLLKHHGHDLLAMSCQPGSTFDQAKASPAMMTTVNEQSEAVRRLTLLRSLGGSCKYARGEWKFTGMAKLVAKEKTDGYKRSDEKTIRADLKEAAQEEREAKSAGFATGLGKL